MKLFLKFMLGFFIFLVACFIFSLLGILDFILGIFAVVVLGFFISMVDALRSPNPFDRKLSYLNKKLEKYHLSIHSFDIEITLLNWADKHDLRTAICEFITRSDDLEICHFKISGEASLNSDFPFSVFSFENETVSFENMVVKGFIPSSFVCGYYPWKEFTPPKNLDVLELISPCNIKEISIRGENLPILSPCLDCPSVFSVPYDFVISIPKHLRDQLQSSSSWSSASFVTPDGNPINPFRFY